MPSDLIRMSGNDKLGKTIIKKTHNNALQRTGTADAAPVAELYRYAKTGGNNESRIHRNY